MEGNRLAISLFTLFIFNLFGLAVSGRLKSPTICGLSTCEPGTKFNYSTNVQYLYDYNVEIASLFRGTSENRSTLYVKALVHLNFVSACQGNIKVTDVLLSQENNFNEDDSEETANPESSMPNAENFADAISKYPLRFSFYDGNIEEICPDESEPVWVLNFKRGILSAFHTTMTRFDIDHDSVETDINGHCQTRYQLQKAKGTSLIIHKVKKLETCSSRYDYHTIIQANPYRFGSDFQTIPLVKSRHKCEFSIDHKVYNGIECEEIHTFQPFSKDENGSQTTIRQSFQLISEGNGNSTVPERITKRTNLLFDHAATPKPTSGELKVSRDLIKTLCKLNVDDVQGGYSEAFAKFIQTARRLSHSALLLIYNRAGSVCSSGRKHVMDAFPYLGSNAAVTIMKDAILSDSIPEATAHEWLLSMAFIPQPDEETVSLVVPLIHHPNAKNESQYLFSVSSLIHTYCKHNSSCQKNEDVKKFLEYLEQEVVSGCSQGLLERMAENKMLIALKSLGNVGLTTGNLESQIKQCIDMDELNMDVRVAAIQSHRRLSCSHDREYYLDVFRNSSYDTELRIASYLEVMRCPNYFVTTVVRKTLEEEDVNQVGSFVWSHLHNLLKSSALNKVEIQSLLTDKNLNEKFNMDRRKFSRNYEHSIFLEEYNVGGNVESNLIFSPKSYLPRSGMVNLTVDMFGRSVNVFEMDVRLEGFEHVLEYAFGPGGPFSATEVGSKIEKLSRVIRGAPEKEPIEPSKSFPNVIDNNFKYPKLGVGFKVFGNEISYSNVAGHPEFNDLMDKMNPELRIRQILSGKEINFNKAGMFLDADYIVPTGTGFPLTLAATGTAAVNLNVAGNIRSLHILALDVKGKFRPSVAIDVMGQMGVDAYYASTGIKLKTSLYSSTALDGHIKVEGTTFAKVSFNLPKEKEEIITARSELIVMNGDQEEIQSGITDNRVSERVCSWPTLDHTLGLKLCADIAFPNATEYLEDTNTNLYLLGKRKTKKNPWPTFILNGPAKFAMTLYKADPTAKEYVLQYNWIQDQDTTTISVVYDTPHSEQKRELSARLLLNKSSRNLTLLLRAVDNKFEAHGKYKYTPTEKYLDFSLDVNGKKQFIAQVGLRTKEVKYGYIYQPKLYLAINEERIAELSGTVKIIEKNEINQCDVNLEFKTKKLSTKLFGYISRGSSSFSADLKLSYQFSTPEYVRVTLKWVNKSSKSLTQFNGEFSLDTSAYKHFNFESSLKYQRAQGHAECTIIINTQPQLKDEAHKFTIKFVFSLSKGYNRTKLHTYIEITKPISHIDLNLELKVDINHHGHDDKSTTVLVLRYATGKEIIATLDLSLPRSEMFKLDAKLNVTLPSFVPMILTTRIEEKKSREYDLEATITWFSGHNLTAKGIYIDKSEGVVTSHSIKLFLQSPSFNDISFNGKFLMDDVQFKLDLQADHNNEKYAVLLRHAVQSPLELDLYGEIRYKSSVYSLTTIVNLMKQRQVLVELHLDQYRDIHITLNGVNIPTHKQAGIEIKWDANRDPSQRFEALVRFQHPRSLNFSTDFSVSYPGRHIKGMALFALFGTKFESSASMEWSPNEMIDVKVGAVYQNVKGTSLRVTSQLLTPFAGWRRTSVNAGIHRENNQVRLNGTVWWQDNQTVSLDIFGDYALIKKKSLQGEEDEDYSDFDLLLRPDIPDLWVEFSASLISTVAEVKPMSASFKHKQNNNRFDTVVHLRGQTNQLISINSSWELSPSPNSTNVTGTVFFVSPYKGYEKGVLVGRLYFTIDLDIHGVAELDLDKKKYGATIDGYLKSIRDNMLIIDVSTPIEAYSKITGKLGYSEVHRHLMCIWESPSSSIGFEILFNFQNAANFDLKFLVATPFEFFSRLLLRGKLTSQMADFKIGLNNLLLGFEGYWRYKSLYDLDYKYILYTPLEGFRENGVVARIIYKKDIDVELSLKVAEVKLGAKLLWGPKSNSLIDLKAEEEEAEDEEKLRWEGHIQIDTYFYPTITGNLDIDEEEDIYTIEGDLRLPNGTIELYDKLNFEDIFTIKNDLFLNTSFEVCKKVTSDFNWNIMLGEYHIVGLDIVVFTYSQEKKGRIFVNYTTESLGEEDEEEDAVASSNHKIHRGYFRLDTPWKEFLLLDVKGWLETEDNTYKTNVTLFTDQSYFSAVGNLESEDGFIDAAVGMVMTSPTYNIPEFKLSAKREFTATDKNVEIMLFIKPPILKTYHFEWIWHYEPSNVLKLRGKVETPIEYLKRAEVMLAFSQNAEEKRMAADSRLAYHPNIDIKFSGLRKDKSLSFEAETPLKGFEKLHFTGSLTRDGTKGNAINGVLVADKIHYNVEGSYETSDTSPLSLSISLRPRTEGVRSATIGVEVTQTEFGCDFKTTLQHGPDKLTAQGKFENNPKNTYALATVIEATYPELKHIDVDAKVVQTENGMISLDLNGVTPWKWIETVHATASYLKLERTGRLRGNFVAPKIKSFLDCDYTWSFMEQMELIYNAGYTSMEVNESKHVKGEVYYRNPGKSFKYLSVGVDTDVDGSWVFGANGTLLLPALEDIKVGVNLKLPPPEPEVHSLIGKLRYSRGFSYVAHTFKYTNEVGKGVYGTSGEVSYNKSEIQGNLKLEWGNQADAKAVTNVFLMKRSEELLDVQYNLHTPYYKEDTVLAKLISAKQNGHFDVKAHLYSPKSKLLSFADVRFSDISNMNGTVNTTTPFSQLSYAGTNFDILTQKAKRSKRYVQVFWSNNTALLDSDYNDVYKDEGKGFTRKVDGKLLVEIPLATRHIGDVTYGYEEIPLQAFGHCIVDYNKKHLLDGKYKCNSESRAGFDKDVIDISVENTYLPLGIHYVRQFEYSGGNDGTNYPTIDKKTADVFKLNNRTSFNLKGILEVKTTHTGKDIKMTAIHANRTVDLDTNYHFLDHEFKHSSWIRLDPEVWSSYEIHIINKTVVGQDEEHAIVNIAYPKRNFTITGFFRSNQQHHESELKLDWDRPEHPKTIGAGVEWWRVSRKPDQQVLTVSFKHPSFVKDVTFNGTYTRHGTKSLFTKLDVEYSDQASKKLVLEGKIQDLSTPSEKKYTMNILAKHPATKLDLLAKGEAYGGFGLYRLDSNAQYERSFLTLQRGTVTAKLNTNDKEVDLHKRFQHDESYLRAKFTNEGSCCSRLNGSIAKTDALNYTGDFFVDVDEKILEFLVNMTPDAEETFHASGRIPDARNAHLNIWRDYDDVTISDVSFYLKLNHSRLVTSKLKWRPKLQKEVISGLELVYTSVLKHVEDTVEYWKVYTRSEIKEAIYDIWLNAKPHIQQFLDEMEDLKTLEQDFEEFKKFLNDSYNNNDFYIKDITGRIVVLVEELAINGHVQSLPDILNEMWQVMGESGEAIRNSIVWIIETVKTSYRKAMDFLRGFIRGDSTEQISALISNIIDKYDRMVKDLQVTVVRHLEQLWNNFVTMLSEYWEFFLKSVEPTFIKFVHYAEAAFLQASNEILDFLYERKVELIKSPYFAKLANFTADFDKFYKDITKNSTFSNIKKYSVKFYEFLKEKYFTIVPFGKEIQEIVDEIVNELKELNKLPSINYLVTKTNEVYNKLVWIWESLDLGTKTQAAITLIHSKLTDGTQSALEADNRYRKAKTKFVFDVDEGLVLLEQKLPMSWHAFNETPKFEEIPEYRVLAELQNYLVFSNKTFWTFYYEYKPYTEIQNWFPPFKAQAIIAGTQFFMTFDKTFYEFKGPCEYLLAHDFVNENFSLIMTKDPQSKSDHFVLTLISHNIPISIDMFADTVKLPKMEVNHLPAEFGDLYIYKESGVITVEDKDGYVLQCNVLFKVCSLMLSGWYFGKTAGLLGTMDHEKTTDFLTSDGFVENDIGRFARTWALDRDTCQSSENHAHVATNLNEELFNVCATLFKSKNSQFSTCFARVNPIPFMTMCLNSKKTEDNSEVCTAAVAYTVACQAEYTPLPVPDFCIQCKGINGEVVPEGEYFELSGNDIPHSTDVVFIIEAKECNRKLFSDRNMEILHTTLFKELVDEGLKDSRFAIVVFGGDGVYDRPRTLLLNQNVFNTFQHSTSYYWNFPIGNGNEDIFEAIAFASHLEFRPGVSKTFIALPCSNCDESNMTIEYSALREVLLDGNIKLHILMNSEFSFEKQRVAKIFYGIDGKKAFTKKDFKVMQGDLDLRRQTKLPQSVMGYCAPLALETNGTIFTALRLESNKKNAVKKFASVFGKRVAEFAVPSTCQKCECSRYESGMSYMDCHPCEYPGPASVDLCLNDYGCDFSQSGDLYDEEILRRPDEHLMTLDGDSGES